MNKQNLEDKLKEDEKIRSARRAKIMDTIESGPPITKEMLEDSGRKWRTNSDKFLK